MTFGGGMAMLPILQREVVENKGWATDEELVDYFAIGQCTPGIIAVNTSTFVGQKQRGVVGGIAATLGISGCSSSKSFTRLVNLVIESVLSSVCNEVRSIQLNKNLYTSGVLFVAKLSHTIFSTADATCASSKSVLYRLNISSYLSIFC